MKIAVLSGKGGAGKTFVAVNLALAAGHAAYIDCDVEEPNGRLFLKPTEVTETPVCTMLPEFDVGKCNGCRKCVSFCRFHALIYIKEKPMVFTEVCHSCGGCLMVCPEQAITEVPKQIGSVFAGRHGDTTVITGILNPGEASGIPVIQKALRLAPQDAPAIIDCPPGSACSVMESVADTDFCVLTAEPTAFGFHNFCMVHELAEIMKKPCGVVINKQDAPYEPLEQYCREKKLPILARIPYDPKIARVNASGRLISEEEPSIRELFRDIYRQIGGMCT